jgi:hypothetical protein
LNDAFRARAKQTSAPFLIRAILLSIVGTLSLLHQNIQDAFNEGEVQIMSPHFEGQPEKPVFVPKSNWFPKTSSSEKP